MTQKAQKAQKEQFPFIDVARGMAAMIVAYFHLHLHAYTAWPDLGHIPRDSWTYRVVLGHFDLGKYAVIVFFMISGFLIPSTLETKNASLRQFVVTRFFRLYPAYWLSMA